MFGEIGNVINNIMLVLGSLLLVASLILGVRVIISGRRLKKSQDELLARVDRSLEHARKTGKETDSLNVELAKLVKDMNANEAEPDPALYDGMLAALEDAKGERDD